MDKPPIDIPSHTKATMEIPACYLAEITAQALRRYEEATIYMIAGKGFTMDEMAQPLEIARLCGAAALALERAADAIADFRESRNMAMN